METTGADVERLWNQALEILRLEMDPQEFETWLRPLRPRAEAGGGLRLEVQNRQVQEFVTENYKDRLEALLEARAGRPVPLTLTRGASAGELFPLIPEVPDLPVAPAGEPLLPRYRFESFVVGPSNQLAWSRLTCSPIARSPQSMMPSKCPRTPKGRPLMPCTVPVTKKSRLCSPRETASVYFKANLQA